MRKSTYGVFLAAFGLVLLGSSSAWAQAAEGGGIVAPSEYVEDIETPTDVSADVMNESDALDAEAAAIAAGQAPASESEARQRQVEEIVVSARKRQELLEDTPVSVTALSEETLREAGVNRIDDIQQLVPNVTFQTSSNGSEALVYIRGVGLPRALTSFDPGVGIYVDGVFLPRAQGSLLDVVDVAQIEVLRGPQGTLFGKNTVGGAVSFTTQKPTDQLEAFAFVRAGNVDGPRTSGINLIETRAMINVPIDIGPLEDHVFVRAAIGSQNRAGYMYNQTLDQNWSDQNSLAFLGSIRILPHEDVTIDISGNWDRSRTYGPGGECEYVRPSGLSVFTPGLAEYCQGDTEYPGPDGDFPYRDLKFDDYYFAANYASLYDITSTGAWGVLNWDIGPLPGLDDFAIKAIGSWREQRIRQRGDVDITPVPAVQQARIGDVPVPVPEGEDPNDALLGLPTRAQQLQAELQVNGSALNERLNFVGGYFVFWETSDVVQGSTALVGSPIIARTVSPQSIDNWTWALFAQGSYDVTEWLEATAGLRYTEDKKGVTSQQYSCVGAFNGPCTGFNLTFDESESAIFSAWTPMASVAATVPEDLLDEGVVDHAMAYFTWSRGFRGGGFNVIPTPEEGTGIEYLQPFAPENLDSFEIGLKTLAFDRRLAVNLSAFIANYQDIQVTSVRDLGDPDGDGSPDIAQETRNAASATTRGVELEALLNLFEGTRIEGSLGLFKGVFGDFASFSDITGEQVQRAGETFNRVPEMQVHMAAQHSFPITVPGPAFLDGFITPRVDWYYQSKVHFFGPEYYPGLQSGYNLFHARLSYSFNDGQSQFALWSQNIANQRYLVNSVPLVTSFGIAQQLYGLPRTFGAEFSHNF